MRVSIIGPELNGGAGLFGWFVQQHGMINGYTNHFWNGITTLEWAKAAWEVIRGSAPNADGLVQLGAKPTVSKYELLQMFKEIWDQDITIQPLAPAQAVDRTLQIGWERPHLRQQLVELKAWMEVYKI